MAAADFCPVTRYVAISSAARWPHAEQISPDKNVNFPCATAPFTVSPVPKALACCAALPRDSALYDVSVRQLTSLRSGFLQTPPHGNALAFG